MPTDFKGFKQGGNTIPVNDTTARNGVIANTKLIKDTVGWSGKNKLENKGNNRLSLNNVTYVKNYDGSVTVNTSDAVSSDVNYQLFNPVSQPVSQIKNGMILSAVMEGNDYSSFNDKFALEIVYRSSNDGYISHQSAKNGPISINIPSNAVYYRISIGAYAGAEIDNVTVYPMLRDADILDDTYEPYFGSTAFPRTEQAVLGAKNLLENIGTTQTKNGVTFTVNADKSVSVNGTATANTEFYLTSSKTGAQWKEILGSKVIMTGCAENGSASTYYIRIIRTNPSWQDFGSDYGTGRTLDISSMGDDSTYLFLIGISNGVTINNLVFKPMIRLATDTDSNYVPYAMTNKELTDVVKNIKYTSNGTSYTDLKQYVVKPTITFENGVGTATLYAPTGETIGTFAVACSNSGKTVAHVNVSGSTATVTLTDTSFSSTNPVTIIYFTYKA